MMPLRKILLYLANSRDRDAGQVMWRHLPRKSGKHGCFNHFPLHNVQAMFKQKSDRRIPHSVPTSSPSVGYSFNVIKE